MAHVRKQIRDALTVLVTGLSSTGAHVSVARATPKPKAEAIDIVVRTPSEQSEDVAVNGVQQRLIGARLDMKAKGSVERDVVDALDQAAAEAEQAIAADITLGGLSRFGEYKGADLSMSGDGEKIIGVLSLAYEFTVMTRRADPASAA